MFDCNNVKVIKDVYLFLKIGCVVENRELETPSFKQLIAIKNVLESVIKNVIKTIA
jgi:hypothetical protein